MTGFVMAGLTALFGTHKVISAYMRQREFVGIFHEAEAALKDSLYTLERKWDDEGLNASNPALEFLLALEEGLENAREIIRAEQKAYFDSYKTPNLDLGGIMKSAATNAFSVWNRTAALTIKYQQTQETESATSRQSAIASMRKVSALKHEMDFIREFGGKPENKTETAKARIEKKLLDLELRAVQRS